MGAAVSCVKSVFRVIGNASMTVVYGIANILKAIVNGVADVFGIIISFLTCRRTGFGAMGSRANGRRGWRSPRARV